MKAIKSRERRNRKTSETPVRLTSCTRVNYDEDTSPMLFRRVLRDHYARILQRAVRRSGLTEAGWVIV